MYKLSRSSRKNLKGVDKEIMHLLEISITYSPYDFGIPKYGGFRSEDRQRELYEIGRRGKSSEKTVTNCDGKIKKSYHQSGFAFDIFIYDEHGACWDCTYKYKEVKEHIFAMFDFAKNCGYFEDMKIEWGGDWKFRDIPHFQIVGIK